MRMVNKKMKYLNQCQISTGVRQFKTPIRLALAAAKVLLFGNFSNK
jgi:hypothetical protein